MQRTDARQRATIERVYTFVSSGSGLLPGQDTVRISGEDDTRNDDDDDDDDDDTRIVDQYSSTLFRS